MIVWLPLTPVSVAAPLPSSGALPSRVLSPRSVKLTVPEGSGTGGEPVATCAVKVSDGTLLCTTRMAERLSDVVVGRVTNWSTVFEVPTPLLASPPYCAVITCSPGDSVVVSVARARLLLCRASVPLPIELPPSKKVTVPVGGPLLPATRLLKVIGVPCGDTKSIGLPSGDAGALVERATDCASV